MTTCRGSIRAAMLLSLAVCIGCGDDAGPELGLVSGTVTLDGQPLAEAAVIFSPITDVMEAGSSAAYTDDQGDFTLKFGQSREGAYLGDHKVIIDHPLYLNENLAATVSSGDNTIDFPLKADDGRRPRWEQPDNAVPAE